MPITTGSGSYTVDLPGVFDSYFSGSSIAQGQTNDLSDREAHTAYRSLVRIKRGRGSILRITGSRRALLVIREYAHNFIEEVVIDREFEHSSSELRAMRSVVERIDAVLK